MDCINSVILSSPNVIYLLVSGYDKKEWNNAISRNMDGSKDCHSEWSKSDREAETAYDIPYKQNIKRYDTNTKGTKSTFPGSSDGKASAYNVGDPGLIPGSGRSSGKGNGNPLQYSCLENPMDGAQ